MIRTIDFGKHSGVAYAEFGTGDIRFTKGRETNEEHGSLLMFRNNDEPRKIGETDNEEMGVLTDDCEKYPIVFKFRKKESIQAVIHSLQELLDQFPETDGPTPSYIEEKVNADSSPVSSGTPCTFNEEDPDRVEPL